MEPFKSNSIKITMRCSKTKIPMGLEDNQNKIYGFQFHPESFLTENGNTLIKNLISLVILKKLLSKTSGDLEVYLLQYE